MFRARWLLIPMLLILFSGCVGMRDLIGNRAERQEFTALRLEMADWGYEIIGSMERVGSRNRNKTQEAQFKTYDKIDRMFAYAGGVISVLAGAYATYRKVTARNGGVS